MSRWTRLITDDVPQVRLAATSLWEAATARLEGGLGVITAVLGGLG